MIFTNKLLPVALIAALVGGSVGALVMHSRSQSASAENSAVTPNQTAEQLDGVPTNFGTPAEQTAYKTGFADGFHAADQVSQQQAAVANTGSRYVSRNVTRRSAPRRVYYDYSRSRNRSFWDKHRDKLTVAIGTGAGAAIGGLVGGKKGAVIGALSGAGGSALYTYKLRKRNPRY